MKGALTDELGCVGASHCPLRISFLKQEAVPQEEAEMRDRQQEACAALLQFTALLAWGSVPCPPNPGIFVLFICKAVCMVFEERNPWECGGDTDRDSSHFLLRDRMS